mgnify:CR=1 FL=1
MAEANNPSQRLQDRRPLSPHLGVYKMMFTMVMSGLHRITGMCLYAGTLLLDGKQVAFPGPREAIDACPEAGLRAEQLTLDGFADLYHRLSR